MFFTKLIVAFGLTTITFAYQSSNGQLPTDLINDLRKIAQRIVGDQESIFKLTQQLKQLSSGDRDSIKQLATIQRDHQLRTVLAAPESNQIGGNPLVTLQSRINAFFDSMSQLFDNMRHILERFPVPEDTDLDPLKALQTLEQQFQSMLAGLRVDKNLTNSTDSIDSSNNNQL